MDICQIENGHHSITAGTYYHIGIIKAEVYDIEKAFELFTTDGMYWLSNDKEYVLNHEVLDYRGAIMFEISRMLYELTSNDHNSDILNIS